MKNSKTTLRELSAKYRSILKKCFLLNAVAMGLIVATNANAATNAITGLSDYSMVGGYDTISTASFLQAGDIAGMLTKSALINDLNNTEYTDGSFETTLGTQYVSSGNWANEYAQYEFDSNNDGTADAQLAGKTLGDTTIDFTQTAFQFTDQNGNTTDLATKSTGLTTSDFDKAATVIAAEAGSSAHSGSNLTTTTTVAQNTYSYMADTTGTGTPTLHTLTDDAPAITDFSKTINLTGSINTGSLTVTGNDTSNRPQVSDYTFKILMDDGITYSDPITLYHSGDITGFETSQTLSSTERAAAYAAADAEYAKYTADVGNFDAALATNSANLATATTNYNTVSSAYSADTTTQESITTNYNNYTTSYATADANRTAANSALSTAFANYSTDVGNYTTAKAAVDAYDTSVSAALDARTQDQIDLALEDGGAIKTAIDAYDNTGSGLAADTKQAAIDEVAGNVDNIVDGTTAITYDNSTSGLAATTVAGAIDEVAGNVDSIVDGTTAITYDNSTSGLAATTVAEAIDEVAGNVDNIVDGTTAITYDNSTSGLAATTVAGAIDENASAIALLNDDAETEGSVAYAVAQEAKARDTAIATATTMGTTAGKNYDASSSVIAAIESIDTNMGTIHGLVTADDATTTSTGKAYAGNLAVGTTVEEHLLALDASIGDMRGFASQHYATDTNVAANLTALDNQVYANTTAIGTTADGTYVAAANTVGQNLNALDSALGDVRSDMASTQAANNARFAQIDSRIDKLEDKMEKGLAANNALAGLVPLDHTHQTQISAALGGYGSNQALAVGAFHYLNNRTLLNAGVGYGGNSDMSYKVGVTFGF